MRRRNAFLTLSPAQFNALPPAKQVGALIQAVLICSSTWVQNQKPQRWLWLWNLFLRKTDWPVAIADFRNYLDAGRSLLPVPNRESYEIANGRDADTGREFGSPIVGQLLNFVILISAATFEEAFDFSYATAGCLYFTHLEGEGKIHVENTREAQVAAEMAQHRADVAREKAEEAARAGADIHVTPGTAHPEPPPCPL